MSNNNHASPVSVSPATHSANAPHRPIRYPTNAVLGVLDTPEQVSHAMTSLGDAGFWTSEIEVASGAAAADAVHASTGRTGFVGLVLRFAQWLGVRDDELEHKAHYEHELRGGHYVVVIQAPTERRKARATELLRKWGAHSLSFHGRYTIEELSRARYA